MSQRKMSSTKPKKVKIKTSQKGPWKTFKSNWELLLLCMPAVICYILFNYVPMGGLILAFKNFRYDLGLFGSPWAGMANFDFLFKSVDLVRYRAQYRRVQRMFHRRKPDRQCGSGAASL